MKKLKSFVASLLVTAAASVFIGTGIRAAAATKEDVIAAARSVGLYDNYIQMAINHLETTSYTSEQYDQMVSLIYANGASLNDMIKDYLGEQEVPLPADPPAVSDPPVQEPATEQDPGTQDVPAVSEEETPVQNPDGNAPTQEQTVHFSDLTPEQQEEYINNLTASQKKEIIKNLDRDKQLEVINGLIDASAGLGLNITIDSFSKDKLEYSVRNDAGEVVDIASMGVIVDDTGINYTFLILSSASIILISAGGIAAMSAMNKKSFTERKK